MYPLIPYKRLLIDTPLTPNQAAEILRQAVQARSPWFPFWSRGTNGFEGTVLNDRFSINRAIRYRNSFLPILHGRFSANGSGTRIDVRMIMHPIVIVFLLIWCGIVLSAFLGIVFDFLRGGQLTDRDCVPLFMLAFVYFLSFFAFGLEAQKATSMLNDIFD